MSTLTKSDPTSLWPEGEVATATNFVRRFGHYAASSQIKPVYIAQHGRVAWALLSAEQMTRLLAPDDATEQDSRFDLLLDSISTIVLLLNESLQITRMNRAGRLHFQAPNRFNNPVSLWTLLYENDREFLADVCTRVLNSGDTEAFDLDSARYPGRTLHFQIMPFPSGLALLADVVTQARRDRQSSSSAAAIDLVLNSAPTLGRARVDVRGMVTSLNDNLSSMVQSRSDAIVGLRLPALFEHNSSNLVRDALDLLLTSGTTFSFEALMLNGTEAPVPVIVSAAPERDGGAITGGAVIMIRRG